MVDHPQWQELVDAAGEPARRSPELAAHLSGCPHCRERQRGASRLVRALRAARLPAVPEPLAEQTVRRILALGRADGHTDATWQHVLAGLRAGLEELRVELVGDSSVASATVRGPLQAAPRTLRFETDAYAVSVSVDAQGGGPPVASVLRGQVVPLAGEGLPARSRAVLHQADSIREREFDPLGTFEFAGLEPAPIRLALILGSSFLRIGPLPDPGAGGGTPFGG